MEQVKSGEFGTTGARHRMVKAREQTRSLSSSRIRISPKSSEQSVETLESLCVDMPGRVQLRCEMSAAAGKWPLVRLAESPERRA